MLKYLLLGVGFLYLGSKKDVILEKISSWASEKINFQVHKPTNVGYNPVEGSLSFDFNFSIDNFLPISFTITRLVLVISRRVGTDESGVDQWKEIARNAPSDQTRTINITEGENNHKLRITTPVKTSSREIFQTAIGRILGNNEVFKIDTEMVLGGQQTVPLTYSTTFTI